MTLFSVHLDPSLVVVVNDEQNVPAISQLLESDTSLISTRDASGDGGKALAPTDLASEPVAPPPPTAAPTSAGRNGPQVLKKGMPIRVPMLQRARTSTFWTRDKDKRSQAVNTAKASNSLSLKLSSYVAPVPPPKEVPPAAPLQEEKPLDEPVVSLTVESPPVQQLESQIGETPKVDPQSSLSSLLQPIRSLFPPPQLTALAPSIDLDTSDSPPSPTASEKDEIGDQTVGGDGPDSFTIYRPRVLEPVRESTAARRAYTFDWKIDVFGESPVAVKGQRTKYPKHHPPPPTSNAPVLPPIPACPPLDFDATSSTSPPPQRAENMQKDKLKKKESVDSLRRNIQSPLLPLALYRAARRNRSRSTASIGTMFSSSSGLPTSFLRLFSSSDARTSSFATFFSDPSLVSVTSGVSSFEQDEIMTPFGSEVMLGYHHAAPAGVRLSRDESGRDEDPIQPRRMREAGRTSLDLSSPTSSIRRAIDAMGLGSPGIPMELVDALRSNPELHTFFSEDVLAEDMELSNALTNYAQAQSRPQEEPETEEMESLQDHGHEEEGRGEEVEMHSGSTPRTPSTDRSVPEDDSDDD